MRFWIRDLADGTISPSGKYSYGYQETWWTVYPYLGLHRRHVICAGDELYLDARIGWMAFTYEMASLDYAPALYPEPGLTTRVELGLRHCAFFFAACFESMEWAPSSVQRSMFQPRSQMLNVGLKMGLGF